MNIKDIERNKGIPHIEDLPLNKFMEVMKTITSFRQSEKIDGNYLCFGRDGIGFFTSREGKGGARIYDADALPKTFNNSYHRAAHIALETVEDQLFEYGLTVGDVIQIEVLYGELPNTVPYDNVINRIVFVRQISGSSMDYISLAMNGVRVSASLDVPVTTDGKTIDFTSESSVWEFCSVKETDITNTSVNPFIDDVVSFANEPAGLGSLTNLDIFTIKLNKDPGLGIPFSDLKQFVKDRREVLRDKEQSLKLRVKEHLLNELVRGTPSMFNRNGWIEGIVLRKGSEQVKIVDKTFFTEVNEYYYASRNRIGKIQLSTEITEGTSILSKALIEIGTHLGDPRHGTINRKRCSIVDSSNIDSVLVSTIIESALNSLDEFLIEHSSGNIRDKRIKRGDKEHRFCYTSAILSKTYESFASVRQKLTNIQSAVSTTTTKSELSALIKQL